MNAQEINWAVAECMGWKQKRVRFGCAPEVLRWGLGAKLVEHIPNFFADLNACREMEETLEHPEAYAFRLAPILLRDKSASNMDGTTAWHFAFTHATAPQRCEAFLRVKGKWKD